MAPEHAQHERCEVNQTSPDMLVDSGTDGTIGLDYTVEGTSITHIPSPHVGEEYDPRPHEDTAGRTIVYLLIGLLWLLVGGILVLLAFGCIAVSDIKDFSVVLGPVVTLVSAATGFYYGAKYNSKNGGH